MFFSPRKSRTLYSEIDDRLRTLERNLQPAVSSYAATGAEFADRTGHALAAALATLVDRFGLAHRFRDSRDGAARFGALRVSDMA